MIADASRSGLSEKGAQIKKQAPTRDGTLNQATGKSTKRRKSFAQLEVAFPNGVLFGEATAHFMHFVSSVFLESSSYPYNISR